MQVYVLELKGVTRTGSKRFYIGSTKDVISRYEKHVNGEGSEYTRENKPFRVVQVYSVEEKNAYKLEDEITERYILKYGTGVRGGHYLNETEVQSVFMKEKHNKNLCYSCGLAGHYSNSCPLKVSDTSKTETDEDKKKRLSGIKVSLWSSGSAKSKYSDSETTVDDNGRLHVLFGAQTHANNKNNFVQKGSLFCDTSLGGWTVRGLVEQVDFLKEENAFKLVIAPMPESGLSIRTTKEVHGKVAIAKALQLPFPSYNWTSSGIVVHRR